MASMQLDDAGTAPSWDHWLAASVAGLQERSLFRTLRPTVPGLSAVEVGAQDAAQLGLGTPGGRRRVSCLLASPALTPSRNSCSLDCLADQRPLHTLPCKLLQAAMSQADIDAWVADRPPASAALPALAECSDLRVVKLFSLNDYLGLSTHPAVRQAAAEAAMQCGNGEHPCQPATTPGKNSACSLPPTLRCCLTHCLPTPAAAAACRPPLLGAGGRLHQLAPRAGDSAGAAQRNRGVPAVPHRLCSQPSGGLGAVPGGRSGGALR